MANLPIVGCMTSLSIMQDVWNPLGLYLNQKVLKWGKKGLSCGQFTDGRLRDSSEYHAGCMGSIRASFVQKKLKLGKKWLFYSQFTNGRLRDSSEYHAGCMGSIRASFEPKRSKIRQETAELRPIYQWEVG